jgi:hypothetical protein
LPKGSETGEAVPKSGYFQILEQQPRIMSLFKIFLFRVCLYSGNGNILIKNNLLRQN